MSESDDDKFPPLILPAIRVNPAINPLMAPMPMVAGALRSPMADVEPELPPLSAWAEALPPDTGTENDIRPPIPVPSPPESPPHVVPHAPIFTDETPQESAPP